MASIKHTADANGRSTYYVHWREEDSGHGRRRIFKNVDDAAFFFWQSESELLNDRTALHADYRMSWTLEKLVYFFLGAQFEKLERNVIRLSSYTKCRYDLLAIDGSILEKSILKLSNRELTATLSAGSLRWIRSAFNMLLGTGVINAVPLHKARRTPRKPIYVPTKSTVKTLLNDAPVRERIACWLGAVCGLRIGEALALTYADISESWISVHKHISDQGVEEGLKSGVQRRIKMPGKLFSLLEPDLLGSARPLIANLRTGESVGIKYASQGPLKQVLTKYGIKKYHHLRHFAVSRLADRGVDILKVSRMIGHSDIRTTMNIYGHLFGETIDLDFD